MANVFVQFLVWLCFPILVLSQLQCHRCFGKGYCNNGTDPEFIDDTRSATCNVPTDFADTGNPILNRIQDVINEWILKANYSSTLQTRTEGQCLTATIHERWEPYTLRTCVTRTIPSDFPLTLCEQIQSILGPFNVYDDVFTCRSCNNSHRCNDHSLGINDGVDEPPPTPSTTPSTTTTTIAPLPPIRLPCHRCYGKDCNNGTDPVFIGDTRQAVCNIPSQFDDTGNPILNGIQETINGMVLRANGGGPFGTVTEGQCLTATIHEPSDIYTLRTCVLRTIPTGWNTSLCEQIETILRPFNIYDGVFVCRSCNSSLCNDHTLGINDGIAEAPVTPEPPTPLPPPDVDITDRLHCHRCYGKDCNDAEDPVFIGDTRQAICDLRNLLIVDSSNDVNSNALNQLQNAINGVILKTNNDNTLNTAIEGQCLTATIFEPSDNYTLRTCVLRQIPTSGNVASLCEQIESILRPFNVYDGILSCRSCSDRHHCNNQTLRTTDGIDGTEAHDTSPITTEQLLPAPEPNGAFTISSYLILVLISFGSLYSIK